MQKSVRILLLLVLGFAVLLPNPVSADSPDNEWGQKLLQEQVNSSLDDGEGSSEEVVFTEKQKKKLAKLHDRLYTDHVKLVELYAEYGVLTEAEKERKLALLERHHRWLEENGYQWRSHGKWHGDLREERGEYPKMEKMQESPLE